MPLPNDGRRGCVTFEDRIYKLIATNQTDSEEFKTWKSIFGRDKLAGLYRKFKESPPEPHKAEHPGHPDEDGWILVQPDEMPYLNREEILEYGSTLPGGAIYVRLKIHAVQETRS